MAHIQNSIVLIIYRFCGRWQQYGFGHGMDIPLCRLVFVRVAVSARCCQCRHGPTAHWLVQHLCGHLLRLCDQLFVHQHICINQLLNVFIAGTCWLTIKLHSSHGNILCCYCCVGYLLGLGVGSSHELFSKLQVAPIDILVSLNCALFDSNCWRRLHGSHEQATIHLGAVAYRC